MQTDIENYRERGYRNVAVNGSGIQAVVMIHDDLRRVVKFGQDAAYDLFAQHVLRNPSPRYPVIYSHATPNGSLSDDGILDDRPIGTVTYTVTEMEVLEPLTAQEEATVSGWFWSVTAALKDGDDPTQVPDPFGLTAPLLELRTVAANNSIGLDLQKGANYMARSTPAGREIVIIDPFG